MSATDLTRRDTRDTITLEIVDIDGSEEKILRVDIEGLTSESESNGGGGGARNSETTLTVGLGTRNGSVDGGGIGGGSNDEGGTSVEDSSTAIETDSLTINGNGHGTFPETILVNVVEGNKGFGVEFGCIETTEGDLTIVFAIRKTRDLVGSDGIGNETLLGKSLNRGESLLLRKSLNGNAQSARCRDAVVSISLLTDWARPINPSKSVESLENWTDSARATPKVCLASLRPATVISSVTMSPATAPDP